MSEKKITPFKKFDFWSYPLMELSNASLNKELFSRSFSRTGVKICNQILQLDKHLHVCVFLYIKVSALDENDCLNVDIVIESLKWLILIFPKLNLIYLVMLRLIYNYIPTLN